MGKRERDQWPKSSKAKVSKHALICNFRQDYPVLYSTAKAALWWQIEQTRSLKIFAKMIDFSI